MATTTTWKMPLSTSPINGGVMRELEKRLKNRQSPSDSQLASASRTRDQSSKAMTEKQVINENMLQARAKWLSQNRTKIENPTSGTSFAEQSDSVTLEDYNNSSSCSSRREDLVQSCKTLLQTQIDYKEDDYGVDDSSTALRKKRMYSTSSFPKMNHRVIPAPPKNDPPMLQHNLNAGDQEPSLPHKETRSNLISPPPLKSPPIMGAAKAKKKVGAMKKILGLKWGKDKPAKNNSSTSTSSVTKSQTVGSPRVMRKTVSDSTLVNHQIVRASPEESSPINISSMGYQNVFDSPQHSLESRSNTSSPTDMARQSNTAANKKPRPVPRIQGVGRRRISPSGGVQGGSENVSSISSPISPLVNSPSNKSTPTSARSENHVLLHMPFAKPHGDKSKSNSSLGLRRSSKESGSRENMQSFGFASSSYNSGMEADGQAPIKRVTTSRQKKLRQGVCSDGDWEDFDDDYIKMNSVTVFDNSEKAKTSSNRSNNVLTLPTTTAAEKRLSAEYLEIIASEIRPTTNRVLKKGETVPLLQVAANTVDRSKPIPLPVNAHSQESVTESRFKSRTHPKVRVTTSAPPPRIVTKDDYTPRSSEQKVAAAEDSKKGRRIQYTEVSVEPSSSASPSVRKISEPRKFKYQAVTVGGDISASKIEEIDNKPTETGETRAFPSKGHPLLNLARTKQSNKSYYVNRQSLIATEYSKDLPTTMLSTVDPETGKVIWHEYVEIDENDIDKLASSVGVAKSIPIPEKLSMLLKVNNKPTATAAAADNTPMSMKKISWDESNNMDSSRAVCTLNSSDDESDADYHKAECMLHSDSAQGDSDLNRSRASSTSSSDCDYVFNLDDPPSVPPRPDNLDDFVTQLKRKSSGDYSYALIPGFNCITQQFSKSKDRALNFSPKFLSKIAELAPPSIPPKSDSLLREQKLTKKTADNLEKNSSVKEEPYLPPVIVKTKKAKTSPEKKLSSPTFVSYLEDNATRSQSHQQKSHLEKKKASVPQKPIPYNEYKKQKSQLTLQSPPSQGTLDQQPSVEQHHHHHHHHRKRTVRTTGGNARLHGVPINAHKKLGRQRSIRNSHRVVKKNLHHESSLAATTGAGVKSKVRNSPHHVPSRRRKRARHNKRHVLKEQLNRESLALLMENREVIAEHLRSSRKSEQGGADAKSGKSEVSSPRSLNEILSELTHLLESNMYTRDELIRGFADLKVRLNSETSEQDTPINSPTEQQTAEVQEIDKESRLNKSGDSDHQDTTEEKQELRKTSRSSYVNLEFAEEVDKSSMKEYRPPYVNLSFGGDSNDVIINKSPAQKPPYVNLFFPGTGENTVQPSNTKCGITLESCDTTSKSHDSAQKTSAPSEMIRAATCLMEDSPHTADKEAAPVPTLHPKLPRVARRRNSAFAASSESSDSSLSVPPMLQARHERTQSHPNPDEEGLEESNLDYLRRSMLAEQVSSPVVDPLKEVLSVLRSGNSTGVLATSEGNTTSYNHALEMEDERRFTKSAEVGKTHRIRLDSDEVENTNGEELREERSHSLGDKFLHRANAIPAKKKQRSSSLSSSNGVGIFTHKGGKLTNEGSGVTIEIPENAVPRGQSQKIWFEVVQDVYDPSNEDDYTQSLSDSGKVQVETLLQDKKEKKIQLTPLVIVGPANAVLMQPIIIRMPHCLPYRNNSWHLHMLGQPSNRSSEEEEWMEIVNTIGLVALSRKWKFNKFHNKTSYQMHLDYAQIKTSQLGCFKLVGRPIRQGAYAAKKMLAAVYSKKDSERDSIQFDVFIYNAIEDQSNALDKSLSEYGYTPLVKNMPILCFGDGKDMEVTITNDSNCAIPLGTKAIPFGKFWRHDKVGQSHVIFDVEADLVEDDRTLTLKIQQAGSKLYHETNFFLIYV